MNQVRNMFFIIIIAFTAFFFFLHISFFFACVNFFLFADTPNNRKRRIAEYNSPESKPNEYIPHEDTKNRFVPISYDYFLPILYILRNLHAYFLFAIFIAFVFFFHRGPFNCAFFCSRDPIAVYTFYLLFSGHAFTEAISALLTFSFLLISISEISSNFF